ncbi:MAG: Holliday junction resolvase RuvX [Fimbriimonadaceae bacterium]|nr:Holliday junction resolvase RuvX [Fimbriimonadaceae bacterium]
MRLLGVDFGQKRIGIAVGEAEFGVSSPRQAIEASGSLKRDAQTIADIARKEEAIEIVVGMPGSFDDDDRQARLCGILAQNLRDLGWKVELVDETMTSVEAHQTARDLGLTAAERRRIVDSESACRILDRYLGLG